MGERAPIVLVHGFTQTRACWGRFGEALGAARSLRALDLPGHGAQSHRALAFSDAAADLGQRGGAGVYLGYSLGARLCLALALESPELVSALVLISGTAGIRDPAARRERRSRDEARARWLEAVGVAAFLDEWLAQPLFSRLAPADAHLEERLVNTPAGLASSLRTCGTGAQPDLWPRLGELRMPVLVLTGAHDERFTLVGKRLVDAIGANAHAVVIPGAGHAVHLEQPATSAIAVLAFLDDVPDRP